MANATIQTSFAGGEISPQLYARVDLAKYEVGAALLRNFFVDYRGGATNRAGTRFVEDVTAKGPTFALLPFVVSEAASYVLVFSAGLVDIYTSEVYVTSVNVPYTADALSALKYTQSADVLTLVHPTYPPAELRRTSDTVFDYVVIDVGAHVTPPTITAMDANTGIYNYGYLVTAVGADGVEESLPSNPGVIESLILNEVNGDVVYLEWVAPLDPDTSLPLAVARYNIYKWGPVGADLTASTTWGFIGQSTTVSFTDNNIAPNFAQQPPNFGDPFSGGQFQSITVDPANRGSGYVSGDWPAVPYVPLVITGDGTGAAGYAVFDPNSGEMVGVYLTSPGANYTSATITADGNSGTGAQFLFSFTPPRPTYPSVAAYTSQRLAFAAPLSLPQTIVFSVTGHYHNFNSTPQTLATDSLTISLASQEVNAIRSLVSVSYGLLAFTAGESFLINGGSPFAALTPTTIASQPQANVGANNLRPLVVNSDVLFGQAKGNRIRNFSYAWQKQTYTGADISTLAAHLFDSYATVDWAWSEEPFKLVWLVRSDGRMLSCTYVPEQEVYAWARHDTQGLFKNVVSVPEGDVNAVYVIVERHVENDDGDPCWRYYFERLADRAECCILDSWFLDSALSLPTSAPDSPLYLTATGGDTVSLASFDTCAPPDQPPFPFYGYTLAALENYDADRVAQVDGSGFPTKTGTGTPMLGRSVDITARKLRYPVCIYYAPGINDTGHTLWDGRNSYAPSAALTGGQLGLWLAEKDLDTGVVTFTDVYDVAQTVPMSVAGDGTWRRTVFDIDRQDNSPFLTDPRTSNVWMQTQCCEVHCFRASDGYKMTLSPFFSTDDLGNHSFPIGMNEDWVYVLELVPDPGPQLLHLVPRLRTSDETTADELLSYADFDWPVANPLTSFVCALDINGDFYIFTRDRTGPCNFQLWKFTQPSSAPFGGPVVGGSFDDKTGWDTSSGPDILSDGYTQPGFGREGDDIIWDINNRTGLIIFSVLRAEDWTGVGPGINKIIYTVYDTVMDVASAAVWMQGYTAADLTPVADPYQATYYITGNINNTNCFYEQDNYYDMSSVDLTRWLFVGVKKVFNGVIGDKEYTLLLECNPAATGLPTIVRIIAEENTWDVAYPGYVADLIVPEPWFGDPVGVIAANMPQEDLEFNESHDCGFFDSTTNSFYWSTLLATPQDTQSPSNFYRFDPAFAPREEVTFADPPIMRMSFDSAQFPATAAGDIIQVACGQIVLDTVDSGGTATGTIILPFDEALPDDPDGTIEPIPSGAWTVVTPTNTVSGLDHLEGKEVWALADGRVEGPSVVSGGTVMLDEDSASVVVGLRYTQQIKTLYLTEDGLNQGTEQGKRKLITGLTVRLDCTRGIEGGIDFDHLTPFPETSGTTLFSGDARSPIFQNWEERGEVCIEQTQPLPASVLGVIPEVTPGDTGN